MKKITYDFKNLVKMRELPTFWVLENNNFDYGKMKTSYRLGIKNQYAILTDKNYLLFISYSTLVSFIDPKGNYFTSGKYSVTTSKHQRVFECFLNSRKV